MRTASINLSDVFDFAPSLEVTVKFHLLFARPALSDEPPSPRSIDPVRFLTHDGKKFQEVYPEAFARYISDEFNWSLMEEYLLEAYDPL